MDVNVSKVSLHAPTAETRLSQADFTTTVCPICGTAADSFLLAAIRCGSETSIESAFCRTCEHRYLKKLPTAQWFDRYYGSEWDTGRLRREPAALGVKQRVKSLIKQVPLARATWQMLRGAPAMSPALQGRERYLFPFLLGIGETDGFYYQRDADVKNVLEIGCGYGGTLDLFRRRGFTVCGTEASPERVAACRAQGLDV